MSESINLQEVEQNIRRSVNQDGLLYLFMGLLLGLIGLSFWDGRFAAFGGLAALLIFPLERLRQRITYPRIGYVRFKVPDSTVKGILGFAALAVIVLTVVAFAGGGRWQRYLPLVIGVVFALSMYFGASMNGIRLRDWIVIGLMAAAGVGLALLLDDWRRATAIQFWLTAVLLILIGAVDLVRFLRRYPPQEQ